MSKFDFESDLRSETGNRELRESLMTQFNQGHLHLFTCNGEEVAAGFYSRETEVSIPRIVPLWD